MKAALSALALFSALLSPEAATAQGWPERNVTILVPFAAGSTPDLIARVLADGLQSRLGKPFVVENRAGASGNIATNAVAKAAPDGYTLGVSIVGPLVINPLIMSSVPYDPDRDLQPISIVAADAWVGLVAPAATPAPIIDRVLAETRAVLSTQQAEERLRPAFMVPVGGTPAQFRAVLKAERALWEPIIRAGQITSD